MLNYKLIVSAFISGFVWWFTYLFIRIYLNPKNNRKIEKFKLDAFFGGMASFVGVFISYYLSNKLL